MRKLRNRRSREGMICRIVLAALVVFLLVALAVTAALWVDIERQPCGLAEQTISGPVIYARSVLENWDEQVYEAALQRYYAERGGSSR